MVRVLDILSDYLQARGLPHQRLDGTVPAAQRRQRIDHFNAPDSPDFCFLLSTRAGGLGINLMTADTCIIFDSDWNPQADLQAMARAHRIGQKSHVMVYRLVSKDTIEEDVLERARRKMILEYAIINLGVTDKAKKSKTDGTFTSEELSAIIKSGASNMFKANDNQAKLENMNIDDVLEHAEDHDTTENLGGAQLGGEDFLRQFEIADYKADVSWDEIIPKEDRERIEEEERALAEQRATEELIAMNSRRVAALSKRVNPGDTDSIASEEPERKKRKPQKKVVKKPEVDADRELDVNDIRHLYNGLRRYGDIDTRYDEIVAGTELAKLNEENVRQMAKELYDACYEAVKNPPVEKPPEQEIATATDEPAANGGDAKPKVGQKAKAILIEFKGLQKVNAESILQRTDDMKFLRKILQRTSPVANFRIASQVKAVQNWKCQWATKDDAMLLIGVDKHGHGSWYAIRDDPELGFTEKLFLDENRTDKKGAKADGATKDIPGSIHLNRRTDYLISVLREEQHDPGILDLLSGRAVETVPKESKSRPPVSGSKSSSKKAANGDDNPPEKKKRAQTDKTSESSPKVKDRKRSSKYNQITTWKTEPKDEVLSDYESMDEAEIKVTWTDSQANLQDELRPVRHNLRAIRDRPDTEVHNKKKSILSDYGKALILNIRIVGDFIENRIKELKPSIREKRRKHLWYHPKSHI
jgi:chromodomain-helicase-DNA-binding protein 1